MVFARLIRMLLEAFTVGLRIYLCLETRLIAACIPTANRIP